MTTRERALWLGGELGLAPAQVDLVEGAIETAMRVEWSRASVIAEDLCGRGREVLERLRSSSVDG